MRNLPITKTMLFIFSTCSLFWLACDPDHPVDLSKSDGGVISDGAETHPCTITDVPLSPVPSVQTVTFHFTSSAEAWVVGEGSNCSPFIIERAEGAAFNRLMLQPPLPRTCEGPGPPPRNIPRVISSAEDQPELTWDGREQHTWEYCEPCGPWSYPGHEWVPSENSAPQPAPAGRYRATFSVFDTLPSSCTKLHQSGHYCAVDGVNGSPMFTDENQLCSLERTVTVEFSLPPQGDTSVQVDLDPHP